MAKVKIYSTPACPFCQVAKKFFEEEGIEYEDFNVQEDDEKRNEMVEKSGQMSVPVIEIDGEIFKGFSDEIRQKIKEKLGLED